MVLALKMFEVAEPLTLEDIALRLKDYGVEEVEEVEGKEFEVGFRLTELSREGDVLRGVYEESFVISLRYKGEEFRTPVTRRTEFRFLKKGERLFLVIAAKRGRANRLATTISAALSARRGAILEAHIPREEFRKLYEERPGSVKVVVFVNVRLPEVDKLTLYGANLSDSGLYNDYLRVGEPWYAVFEADEGIVIGVTRNCVITFFSRIDPEDAFAFVEQKIMPLLSAQGPADRQASGSGEQFY